MAQVLISKKLLKEKDLMELLRFHYAVDPQNFVKAFNEAGIAIDESSPESLKADFEKLVEASKSGMDINGTFLRKKSGEPLKFSVLSIIFSADMRHDLMDKKVVFDKSNPYLIVNTSQAA